MSKPEKNSAAQSLGRLGGLARRAALTPEQRVAASQHANAIKRKRAALRRLLGGHDGAENSSTLHPN